MDLFDKNQYLTEDAKADLEYSKSNNFLESSIKFVLKIPFKAISSIYGIVKRILLDKALGNRIPPAGKENMNSVEKYKASSAFNNFGIDLIKQKKDSMNPNQLIVYTKRSNL